MVGQRFVLEKMVCPRPVINITNIVDKTNKKTCVGSCPISI